jgi:hypothetical protein
LFGLDALDVLAQANMAHAHLVGSAVAFFAGLGGKATCLWASHIGSIPSCGKAHAGAGCEVNRRVRLLRPLHH